MISFVTLVWRVSLLNPTVPLPSGQEAEDKCPAHIASSEQLSVEVSRREMGSAEWGVKGPK